jgi:hypothetical protein
MLAPMRCWRSSFAPPGCRVAEGYDHDRIVEAQLERNLPPIAPAGRGGVRRRRSLPRNQREAGDGEDAPNRGRLSGFAEGPGELRQLQAFHVAERLQVG